MNRREPYQLHAVPVLCAASPGLPASWVHTWWTRTSGIHWRPVVCGRLALLLTGPMCCWTTHWQEKWTRGCWAPSGTASCRSGPSLPVTLCTWLNQIIKTNAVPGALHVAQAGQSCKHNRCAYTRRHFVLPGTPPSRCVGRLRKVRWLW